LAWLDLSCGEPTGVSRAGRARRAQAAALAAAGITPTHVVGLNVPDDQLVERVVNRRTDPVSGKIYNMKTKPPETEEIAARLVQRADDTEEAVRTRLGTYHKHAAALSAAYATKVTINGVQSPDAVFAAVCAHLQGQ
jgi:adenylate kinase